MCIRDRVCTAPAPANSAAIDLVGDGGVLKQVMRAGEGERPLRGATVEVHYEGRLLDTGAVFDSSRARGKTFKFTLGEGKVIGGWEVGLSTMQVGELCTLTCSSQYAYGAKGIPPMIPPSATLSFEVELLGVELPVEEAQTFADDNPLAPRTPDAIKAAYEKKMAAKVGHSHETPDHACRRTLPYAACAAWWPRPRQIRPPSTQRRGPDWLSE